jgi:hypothetical protein
MDSKTSAASSGSALLLADVLPLSEALIGESFQLMGPKAGADSADMGVPPRR